MKTKKATLFGILGVLAGGLVAIGLQVHAAQVQNPALSAPQVQSMTGTTDSTTVSDPKESPETGTSIEKPDAQEATSTESDANTPGGGHADPVGNVDHQFEGEE